MKAETLLEELLQLAAEAEKGMQTADAEGDRVMKYYYEGQKQAFEHSYRMLDIGVRYKTIK